MSNDFFFVSFPTRDVYCSFVLTSCHFFPFIRLCLLLTILFDMDEGDATFTMSMDVVTVGHEKQVSLELGMF